MTGRMTVPAIPEPIRDPPSTAIAVRLPAQLTRYARSPLRWRTGGEVTVLRDGGETYPAMLARRDSRSAAEGRLPAPGVDWPFDD